eukprot:6174204-Pleurochrysis_carterae.AAC.2
MGHCMVVKSSRSSRWMTMNYEYDIDTVTDIDLLTDTCECAMVGGPRHGSAATSNVLPTRFV